MCWGCKTRTPPGGSVTTRISQQQHTRLNLISTPPLRISTSRVSISQDSTRPVPALQVPAPQAPPVSVAPDIVRRSSGFEQPFGLKVLANGTNPVVDLVAVHGLDGHWEETWTTKNGALWLRDYLPEVVPNIRILTFGYDGRTHGSTPLSRQTLHDHAISLITSLCLHRQGKGINERPIIFIAHSIGGIIVKDVIPPFILSGVLHDAVRYEKERALIHSNSANTTNLEHHNSIKTSTYGVLFFGTPHQGADGLAWKRIFLNAASLFTNTNAAILRDLEESSGSLLKQLGQYKHISTNFDTKFFYETYPPPSGSSIVVPIGSAVVQGATDAEVFSINSDHEGLVKYRSADDHGFKTASSCISLMVEKAPKKVLENWQRWKRIKAAEMNVMQITFDIPFELDYRRNPDFTGRQYLLDTLQNEVRQSTLTLVTVVLHGVGGIGKTDIALEYVYTHQKEYSSIFWINAATKATTIAGYTTIAQRLIKQHAKIAHNEKPDYLLIAKNLDMVGVVDENGRISHKEEHITRMVQGVKLWFTKDGNQNWLLIIDNIDDLDSFGVQNYVPSASHASGTILMTSRRPECARFGKGVEVKEMLELEGIQLLLKSARVDTYTTDPEEYMAAAEVARKFGYLPLSIVQAGAYVSCRKTTFKSYLGIYEEFFNKIFSERPPDAVWSYGDRTALTTWEISFQAIKEENKEAAELLSLCSFLSNDDIREDMLYRGKKLEEDDDITIDHCMILLFSYSLAQRKESHESFYIHPVVHLWARERLESHELVRKAKEAVIMVGNAVKYSSLEKVDYWEYGGKVMVHIEQIGTNVEKYLKTELNETNLIEGVSRIAEVASKLGRFKKAEGLQLLVMEADRKVLGREHPETMRAMINLASTYWDQSRLEEAEEMQLRVIEKSQRVQGEEDEIALTAMSHLSGTYWDQGRRKEAEELGMKVVEIRQRVLGEEHPDTLTAISNLAKSYRYQDRFEEAEKMQLKVLEARKRILKGKNHPDILETMADLAAIYMNQGRLKEAEELELKVLEACQKVLGKEHPGTLIEIANLASVYKDQGWFKEAEELELQVVESSQRSLGNEHSETLIAISNLAKTYTDQQRWEEAEKVQRHVLEVRERKLGKEHPDTLTAIANLAATYANQGRLEESAQLGLQAVTARQRVLGNEHSDTLLAISNLALTYRNQGRLDEAEKLGLQTLKARQRVLSKDHLDTIETMANLALTYYEQGRLNETEQLEQEIVEARKRVFGKDHPETLTAISNLAMTYSDQGRIREAGELELQVLEVKRRVLGMEHPDTMTATEDLAKRYGSQKRWTEAEELELQLVETRQRVLGKEHLETITAMANLAKTYRNQKQWKKAEEIRLQVLEVMGRVLGKEHPETLSAMADLAVAYWDQGRLKEAEELELQVLDMRQRLFGTDHSETLTAMDSLVSTYRSQERWKEAEDLELQLVEARQRLNKSSLDSSSQD